MYRSADEIRIEILKAVRDHPVTSYFKLSNLVKTGFRTVKRNCEALAQYGLVSIQKVPKEQAPSKKESFTISITAEGTRFLERVEKQ